MKDNLASLVERMISVVGASEPYSMPGKKFRYLISLTLRNGEAEINITDRETYRNVFKASCFVHAFDDEHNKQLPEQINLMLDTVEKYRALNIGGSHA
ncbi:hypothetical protein [Gayadomonas joobiniege]|uniref:hypothetical protein n=1 Tax=Gayadomonas joobiniege TaxID=1234606 RepID=UPI00035EF398|nr:hypothetical protein [Gayadomonas joobiniege]